MGKRVKGGVKEGKREKEGPYLFNTKNVWWCIFSFSSKRVESWIRGVLTQTRSDRQEKPGAVVPVFCLLPAASNQLTPPPTPPQF